MPQPNFAGTTTVTVTVREEGVEPLEDSLTFDLTVTTENDPPELAYLGDHGTPVGEAIDVTILFDDPDEEFAHGRRIFQSWV